MAFKIYLKPTITDIEFKIKKNKSIINLDKNDRDANIAKALLLLYSNQPCTLTRLTELFAEEFNEIFDRSYVSSFLKKLNLMGIANVCSALNAMNTPEVERTPMQIELLNKYYVFDSKFESETKGKYSKLNFYWLGENEAKIYVPFCCDLLGIKFEDI